MKQELELEWIEINSQEDLPKDKHQFCWWVNRVNGSVHPDKMAGLLGPSMLHLTFSHYMPIKTIPKPPVSRKQLVDGLYSFKNMSIDIKTKKVTMLSPEGQTLEGPNRYKDIDGPKI